MTAIIGIRVHPSWKAEAKKEAEERGINLSNLIWEFIKDGQEWNKIKKMFNKAQI